MKIYRLSQLMDFNDFADDQWYGGEKNTEDNDLLTTPAYEFAEKRLPKEAFSIDYVSPNERESRGKCKCLKCSRIVKWTACSDVGGVWVWCQNCGMYEV